MCEAEYIGRDVIHGKMHGMQSCAVVREAIYDGIEAILLACLPLDQNRASEGFGRHAGPVSSH